MFELRVGKNPPSLFTGYIVNCGATIGFVMAHICFARARNHQNHSKDRNGESLSTPVAINSVFMIWQQLLGDTLNHSYHIISFKSLNFN